GHRAPRRARRRPHRRVLRAGGVGRGQPRRRVLAPRRAGAAGVDGWARLRLRRRRRPRRGVVRDVGRHRPLAPRPRRPRPGRAAPHRQRRRPGRDRHRRHSDRRPRPAGPPPGALRIAHARRLRAVVVPGRDGPARARPGRRPPHPGDGRAAVRGGVEPGHDRARGARRRLRRLEGLMATTVLDRRPEAPAAPRPSPAPPPPAAPSDLLGLAEPLLAAVTVVAAVGLIRLFANGEFLGPVVAAALGSHAVAGFARRRGLNGPAAAAISLVGLALAVAWLVEPHTTEYGIPVARTWHAVTTDLSHAWNRFEEVVAPAPVVRGFVLVAVMAAWVAGFIADTAAFRIRAPFEAAVPSFTLFVFGSALGADRYRRGSTVLYLGAVLAFLLVAASRERSSTTAW